MIKKRFVVVEDDGYTADDIQYILEQEFAQEAVIFKSAEEYFTNLTELRSDDVYIVDLMMKFEGIPEYLAVQENIDENIQTGHLIMQHIRERYRKARIYVFTAFKSNSSSEEARLGAASKVFYKPLSAYTLIEKILKELE